MKLSEFELDVMQHFWDKGELSSSAVVASVTVQKQVAANTVRTIIVRLEEKGALERIRQEGKALVYRSLVTQEAISNILLPNFVRRLFGNNPSKLVARIISDGNLSNNDIQELRKLLEEHEETPK